MFKKIILIGLLFLNGIVFSQNNKLDEYSWLKNVLLYKIWGQDYDLFSQGHKGIEKITIKINDTISEQQFFNRKGIPYYIKNSFGIRYYEYDKNNRIIKHIYVNPTGGFECDEMKYFEKKVHNYSYINQEEINYEIESQKKLKKEMDSLRKQNNIEQDIVVDEAYAVVEPDSVYYKYLKEMNLIIDPKTLLNSPSFKKLIKNPKFLSFSAEFNSEFKKGSKTYFDVNHKITSYSTFDYLPKKIIEKYNLEMVGTGEIIRELDDLGNVLNEIEGDKTISYKYENGKCIEKKEFKKGVPVSLDSYIYKNNLLIEKSYKDMVNDNVYTSVFLYENNVLISRTDTSRYAKNVYAFEYKYY